MVCGVERVQIAAKTRLFDHEKCIDGVVGGGGQGGWCTLGCRAIYDPQTQPGIFQELRTQSQGYGGGGRWRI